jgi:glycerophosphoryl diester phosphodiesterase
MKRRPNRKGLAARDTKREDVVIVYAHRGDQEAAPENSMAAFAAAVAEGADGVETDLRLTRDGAVVLLHDADFGRAAGKPVRPGDLTLSEVRALRLADGSRVPELREFWDLVRGKLRVNLEIKEQGVAERLPALLGADAASGTDLLVSSSIAEEALRARDLLPGASAGLVTSDFDDRLPGPFDVVSLSRFGFSREAARRCSEAGSRLLVYTVNDAATARKLRDAGVSGIFTDFAGRMRREILEFDRGA